MKFQASPANVSPKGRKIMVAAWVSGTVFFALALRMWCLFTAPVVSRDGTLYISMAEFWLKDPDPAHFAAAGPVKTHLLYVWLIRGGSLVSGIAPADVAIWENLILGSLLPLLLFFLAKSAGLRPGEAVFAAMLAAVQPNLVELSLQPQRDLLGMTCLGGVILFAVRGVNKRQCSKWEAVTGLGAGVSNWLFCGLSLGLLSCVRRESVEWLVLLPIYWGLMLLLKQFSRRELVWSALLTLVGMAVGSGGTGLICANDITFFWRF